MQEQCPTATEIERLKPRALNVDGCQRTVAARWPTGFLNPVSQVRILLGAPFISPPAALCSRPVEAGLVLARRAAADDDYVVVDHEGSSTPACSRTM